MKVTHKSIIVILKEYICFSGHQFYVNHTSHTYHERIACVAHKISNKIQDFFTFSSSNSLTNRSSEEG